MWLGVVALLIITLLLDLAFFKDHATVIIVLVSKIANTPDPATKYSGEILMIPTCVMLILATFPVFLERLFTSTQTVESIRVI